MNVQNQRPGVYSQYDITSMYTTPLSLKYAAVVAKAEGGEAGAAYRLKTYSDACETFLPDSEGVFMRSILAVLFESGVSEVLAIPANSGYQAALDMLETAENIGAVVCDSQSPADLAALKARVLKNSEERRECLGFCGIAEPNEAIAAAVALNCERIVLVCPQVFSRVSGARSVIIAAAALAGKMLAMGNAAINLNGEEFSALTSAEILPEKTIQSLLAAGVTVFENVSGTVECIRALTTRTKTNGVPDRSLTGINTILITDDVMSSIRISLKKVLRGGRINGSPIDSIRSQVAVVLGEKQNEGLLESFEPPHCYASLSDPAVCVVELSFAVAHVISQIHVTAHILV